MLCSSSGINNNRSAICMAAALMIIITMLVIQVTTSSTDMLFIRHGRSRVRHSNEKDHLRWGLQAFDNLTLDYDDYDNDTVASGSGIGSSVGQLFGSDFWLNSDSNGTFFGSNNQTTVILRHELMNSSDIEAINLQVHTTITAPVITTPQNRKKKKYHKKKSMENIRKNVDKGLEYLKSHKNLAQDEDTVLSEEVPIQNDEQQQLELQQKLVENMELTPMPATKSIQVFGYSASSLPFLMPTWYSKQQLSVSPQRETLFMTTEKYRVGAHIKDDEDNNNGDVHKKQHFSQPTSLVELYTDKNNEADYENIPNHAGDIKPNHSPSTIAGEKGHRPIVPQEGDVNFEEIRLDGDTDDSENDNDNFDTGIDNYNGEYNGNSLNLQEAGRNIDTNKFLEGVVDGANEDELYDWDEISRNNRRNLMRGRDVVTKFLQIVETQHSLGSNCEAGTSLNLGEGVVDRYAQDRFRVEAEVAVNRANMLTRIFKMTSPSVQSSVNLLHASVLSMVEFDDDIFAAGNCFDWNQHPSQPGLFCPFAYRLPPPNHGALFAKDLAMEYHYLGNTSEWFFLARKNAEKVIARNDQYIKAFHLYSNKTEERVEDNLLFVRYEDGRWSKPYYDCGGGNIWMLTYTVPFFGYENRTYFFKGTSGIDIDLRRVDIDQCPQRNTPGATQPLNIFAGTDKCKQRTTMCTNFKVLLIIERGVVHRVEQRFRYNIGIHDSVQQCEALKGLGFRRGSYKCICRKGFFFPDTLSMHKFFNGSVLEEEYEKLMLGKNSTYNIVQEYECLPCAEGCDSCEDSSPCIAALNWPMRTSILVLACTIIGLLPPAAWFTFRYQQVKVVRAASPALLRVIAMGAFLIYCTTIVMYPNPSLYTCTSRIWLREIGFSLTYGALMLKTWRISVIFRVRSAKAVKITDGALLKRLGVICGVIGTCLLVRTLVSPPDVVVGRTADDLKAFLCKTDWWDYTFTSMEVLFLAWGVRLCIMVRKAPSEFNESRFISMAIYNEFLLTCFLNVSMLFLQSPANPDLLFIIFFCHTQLTVTLLLGLIFGSKVYIVLRSGKSHQESIGMGAKSSGAKFNFRPQVRTFANPSSLTTSTAQLETKLSEQEALEEVRLLSMQLQRIQEMAPPKGVAVMTISHLLDGLKNTSSSQLQTPTLKAQPTNNDNPTIQQNSSFAVSAMISNPQITKPIKVIEKSINTSMTGDDFLRELVHENEKIRCSNCACVKNSEATVLSCQQLGSPKPEGSISFSNIKLDCMCSRPCDLDLKCGGDERKLIEPIIKSVVTSTSRQGGRGARMRAARTSKFYSSSNLGVAKFVSAGKQTAKTKLIGGVDYSTIICDKYKSSDHFLICDSCRYKLSSSLKKLSSSSSGERKTAVTHRSNEVLDRSLCERLSVITDSFSSTTSTIGDCGGVANSIDDLNIIHKKMHSTEDVTFYTTDDDSGENANDDSDRTTFPKNHRDIQSTSLSTSILPENFAVEFHHKSVNNGSQGNVSSASSDTKPNSDAAPVLRRPDKLLLDLNDRSKYTKEVSV